MIQILCLGMSGCCRWADVIGVLPAIAGGTQSFKKLSWSELGLFFLSYCLGTSVFFLFLRPKKCFPTHWRSEDFCLAKIIHESLIVMVRKTSLISRNEGDGNEHPS